MNYNILWLFLCITVTVSESYRILGIFPFNAKSHNVMFNALIKGLTNRGHQVDVITHFPLRNPPKNYKVVVNLDGTQDNLVNNFTIDFVNSINSNGIIMLAEEYGNRVCQLMGLESMQKFIKNPPKDPPYDLVIAEVFSAHCYLGFGNLLNVPVIAVSSSIEYPWIGKFIGNDDNLAYVTTPSFPIFSRMNFWDRLQNFYIHHNELFIFQSSTEESQTLSMRKYLRSDIPNIRDVEKSVALTLVNSDYIIYGIKPITPGLIQVGGLHVGHDDSKLSPELKKWLDEGHDGVIYFTFGSMVLIESLPENNLKDIYLSFSKIAPIRILMKIADKQKLPPGLPTNVLTSPWIPQEAVLSHKNVRAFITHGGLMGSQEALHYGVPMVGIPLFGDQSRNVAAFEAKNMTVKLDLKNLNTQTFDSALDEVLNNPKYRKYAKYYSKLFRDRPMSPMESAIFWIEYVIRNGPDVLKSPALKLNWWELAHLDIYCFLLSIIILSISSTYYCIKLCIRKCSRTESRKLKTR